MKSIKIKEMKNLYVILSILLFNTLTYGQTYSEFITDKEVYSFIKNRYCSSTIDSEILKWEDREFDKNIDFNNFFNNSIQNENDKLITDSLLSDFRKKYESVKKTNALYFKLFKEKKHKRKFLRISIPLISTDGKYAIIKTHYWYGDEGGNGGISIFEKRKNKWVYIESRCTWIS